MIRNRTLLKSLTVFFIVEILVSTIIPSLTWALTAGPTAPEATSFEPVDTTDMVNLASGDLAYNIPLLEVPGPSGGYPLSLSYHAGIMPNEESSWVGTGWTLNPGAIVRNVNGFADDHLNADNFSRFFWKGGNVETYSIGASVGLAGTPASVSAGLSFSQDTYQGAGVGANLGVGSQLGNSPLGVGANIGISPYGDPYASTGFSVSIAASQNQALTATGGVGISSNFENVGTYGTAGLSVNTGQGKTSRSISALDATISSSGNKASANVGFGGASFAQNTNAGRISTSSSGFSLQVPVWYAVSISLGYNYQRYWIDQLDNVKVNGVLNFPTPSGPNTVFNSNYFDNKAFDSYNLIDPESEIISDDTFVSDTGLGGTFPNADNYLVHAQGLFGVMRPYLFQKHLYGRNNYETNSDGSKKYKIIQYDLERTAKDNKRAEFRFINDFSNRFEYTPSTIQQSNSEGKMEYNFSSGTDLKIGENGNTSHTNNLIQGSRSIEWFTNAEISSKVPRVVNGGFIETKSSGFDRSASKGTTIGGYTITNESGVKYNFSLPAYSYAEFTYSENKSNGLASNEFYKPEPYAYTWYLTSVIGPDYVDSGTNGVADGILNEYDLGYWVEFDYGKWTDQYAWRNPSEQMNSDLDNNFQNFSEGKKEVYYLDAIRTKTHTALFVKDIRNDGKSSIYSYRDISNFDVYNSRSNKEVITNITKEGHFTPKVITNTCSRKEYLNDGNFVHDEGTITYTSRPVSSLKLNKIILIKNEHLNSFNLNKLQGEIFAQNYTYNWNVVVNGDLTRSHVDCEECNFSAIKFNAHLYQNTLDIHDLNGLNIQEKAIRIIEFDNAPSSSDLCPETPNSFDYNIAKVASPPLNDSSYPKLGKLTLSGLKFKGIGGADIIPPMKFLYDLERPLTGYGQLSISSGQHFLDVNNSQLTEGDILKFSGTALTSYAVIEKISGISHRLKIIGKNDPPPGPIYWQQTKNPPYNKERYDLWGYYKSDFDASNKSINENYARETNPLSSKNVDVWSLRSIRTSLGSTISLTYESDSYKSVVSDENNLPWIKSLQVRSNENGYIDVYFDSQFDPISCFELNSQIDVYALIGQRMNDVNGSPKYSPGLYGPIDRPVVGFPYEQGYSKSVVTNIYNDHISIYNVSLYQTLTSTSFVGFQRDFLGGNIQVNTNRTLFGGGLRVKSVSITGSLQKELSSTNYHYEEGKSSYTPLTSNISYIKFPDSNHYGSEAGNRVNVPEYLKFLNSRILKIVALARELPPPGVLYSQVTVKENVKTDNGENQLPSYSQYEFETFKEGMVGFEYSPEVSTDISTQTYDGFIPFNKKITKNVALKDYTSRLGTLKKVALFNTANNTKITETINHYLHDGIEQELLATGYSAPNVDFKSNVVVYENRLNRFNNQGVTEESFANARFVKQTITPNFALKGIITKREQFPLIQTGQTVINYKTGLTNTSSNISFDYYGGQVTKTRVTDGHGNTIQNEILPAYRQYPLMGLASGGGKNMLTQKTADFTYKIDLTQNDKKIGLLSASVQTWSDQINTLNLEQSQNFVQAGMWRKHGAFFFAGENNVSLGFDGLYPLPNGTLPSFTAWNKGDNIPNGWRKASEVELYDVNSHVLEVKDMNGNYAATKMSSDQTMVLATGANGGYYDFAFSGAEDLLQGRFGGNVVIEEGQIVNDKVFAHTGDYSLLLNPAKKSFVYQVNKSALKNVSTKYRASVWVKENSPNSTPQVSLIAETNNGVVLGTASAVSTRKSGAWYLINLDFDLPISADGIIKAYVVNNSGSGYYVDDFRLHPYNAEMNSYVYDKWGKLSHVLDNNNLFTEYTYDQMGRLTSTFKESFQYGKKQVNETEYHFSVPR